MKKLISTILASAIALSSSAALAQSRTMDISEALSVGDEIHIIYNDTAVKYDDVKPVNRQDRVMIPFRAALETMGALVEYDSETRVVKATKGDTTIDFTLMSDTINVDKNGEKSQITMDVPMIIEQDRTFVPIRFMSNALGMQVGWDGETETVVIADYSEYVKEFADKAPNLFKIASLNSDVSARSEAKFDISLDTTGESGTFNGAASGSYEAAQKDGRESLNLNLSLKGSKLNIENANVQVVLDGFKVYVKTDVLDDLADIMEDESAKLAAAALNPDLWYSVDIMKLFAGDSVDSATLAAIEAALQSPGQLDLEKIIMNSVKTEGDATLQDITDMALILDAYEAMDEYIDVKVSGDDYSLSIDITPELFVSIIDKALDGKMSEEDKEDLRKMFNVTIKSNSEKKGDNITSSVDCNLDINDGQGTMCKAVIKLDGKSETGENIKDVEIPANALDITSIIASAVK